MSYSYKGIPVVARDEISDNLIVICTSQGEEITRTGFQGMLTPQALRYVYQCLTGDEKNRAAYFRVSPARKREFEDNVARYAR